MTAEGVIAVVAGILANSVALIGFGIDSAIEGLASVVIIWRFSAKHALSETAEQPCAETRRGQLLPARPVHRRRGDPLARHREEPDVSRLGIGLTFASILLMPLFGIAKKRIGAKLGSRATAGEGTQNLICAYLAVGVLAGLLANAAFGWWWLDAVVALGIAAVAIHEGRESWQGEECCWSSLAVGPERKPAGLC